MKYLFSIVLSACFLIQNISKTIIVLSYEANKEYIAKNLCVNRDEPESCCHGKCELKKQLQQDDKSGAASDAPSKYKVEKSEYCDTGIKSKLIAITSGQISRYDSVEPIRGFYSKTYRPPSRCCSNNLT